MSEPSRPAVETIEAEKAFEDLLKGGGEGEGEDIPSGTEEPVKGQEAEVGTPPIAPTEVPSEPPPPPPPPVGEKPPEEKPPEAKPQEEPPKPPLAKPPEEKPPEPPAPPTREQILAQRQRLVDDVAGRYGFTEEEVSALQTEPEKVLPKLAGKLFVDVYESVLQTVWAQMPSVLNTFTEHRSDAQKAEDAFYEAYPQLNKPEYKPEIYRIGAMYRQMYPQATKEQFIRDVGTQGLIRFNLHTTPPAAPTTTPPFTPAAPGGAPPAAPGKKASVNPFEQMSKEFEELDGDID